jgi:hypothetical protein
VAWVELPETTAEALDLRSLKAGLPGELRRGRHVPMSVKSCQAAKRGPPPAVPRREDVLCDASLVLQTMGQHDKASARLDPCCGEELPYKDGYRIGSDIGVTRSDPGPFLPTQRNRMPP